MASISSLKLDEIDSLVQQVKDLVAEKPTATQAFIRGPKAKIPNC